MQNKSNCCPSVLVGINKVILILRLMQVKQIRGRYYGHQLVAKHIGFKVKPLPSVGAVGPCKQKRQR